MFRLLQGLCGREDSPNIKMMKTRGSFSKWLVLFKGPICLSAYASMAVLSTVDPVYRYFCCCNDGSIHASVHPWSSVCISSWWTYGQCMDVGLLFAALSSSLYRFLSHRNLNNHIFSPNLWCAQHSVEFEFCFYNLLLLHAQIVNVELCTQIRPRLQSRSLFNQQFKTSTIFSTRLLYS